MAGDARIVNQGQNQGDITALTIEALTRRNAAAVMLVNTSGDVYNALGSASGGDGAILDGADTNIKATVKDNSGVNPLHVIITNASGDTPNLAPPGGADGAVVDGADSSIKATVKDYSNSNPLVVTLANVSGDIYNALGAAAGGDGAILDGADTNIKATVLNTRTARPAETDNPILVQLADDSTREVGRVTNPIGAFVTSGQIGVTGDVSTTPKAGETWPVSFGTPVTIGNITAPMGISGDTGIRDAADPTIRANVKNYTVSNPLAVVLVNPSGDTTPAGEHMMGRVGIHKAHGLIDEGNSSISPLGADEVFTGIGIDVSDYSTMTVMVFADQDSATDGMSIEFSTDNTNWDDKYLWTITANTARRWQFPITGQFFRIVYTNSGTPQTAFRMQAICHPTNTLTSIHRIGDVTTSDDRSAQLVKAVITVKKPNNNYVNVQGTASGNLKVAVEEFDTSLPAGSNVLGTVKTQHIGPVGVQVVGGHIGATITPSGDRIGVHVDHGQVGVTGDVSTTPKAGEIWPVSIAAPLTIGAITAPMGISGDIGLRDGADPTIAATVKNYSNANPVTVALTNASGDIYNAPSNPNPTIVARSGRITGAGSTTIAGPFGGKSIFVTAYDLQAESDTGQMHINAGASGEQLTPQWLLNAREGVAKQVSGFGNGYLVRTQADQALVLENAGANFRYSVSYFSGDN